MRNLRHRHPLVLVRLVIASPLAPSSLRLPRRHPQGDGPSHRSTSSGGNRRESVDVGFTILQHGQTSAVLESGVGLQLALPDGTIEFSEAVAEGVPGHTWPQ